MRTGSTRIVRYPFATAVFAVLLAASPATAVPPVVSADDTDDDATITLRVLNQAIRGDRRSWCEVRIVVGSADVRFSNGDQVFLWVYEDDLAGDDLLWSTSFRVTAQEVGAQRVDRTFDCTSDFGDDVGNTREVYAEARVEKDQCGALCRYDRPQTRNIDVAEVDDDGAEEDDAQRSARATPIGRTANRIARDQDWFGMSLLDRSLITFEVEHRPNAGRLDVTLFDANGQEVQRGQDGQQSTLLESRPLAPGEYAIRVSPRNGDDFNFYDVTFRLQTGGCNPGAIEAEPCGNCGQRRRSCNDEGQWGAFGECEGEGPCRPGDMRGVACGNCGQEAQICTAACFWEPGACAGEGECRPGDVQGDACPGDQGQRTRTCGAECTWGAYGNCDGACMAGETRSCYDGPPGTAGVGACREGRQRCENGGWGPCEGDVQPAAEDCRDGQDNDCDGDTDAADLEDCDDGEAAVGDPCTGDADCGDLTCEDDPLFTGGYCTTDTCEQCPGDAVCGRTFGRELCLKPCERPSDCRAGYRCADVDADELACIPACRNDADCQDPALPRCDRREGLCVSDGASPPDVGPVVRDGGGGGAGGFGGGGGGGAGGGPAPPDPQADAGFGDGGPGAAATAEAECASCRATAPASAPLWLLLLVLLPAWRRRRG